MRNVHDYKEVLWMEITDLSRKSLKNNRFLGASTVSDIEYYSSRAIPTVLVDVVVTALGPGKSPGRDN